MTKKKASKPKPAKGKPAPPEAEPTLEAESVEPTEQKAHQAEAEAEAKPEAQAEAKVQAEPNKPKEPKQAKEAKEPGAKSPPRFVYNCVNCGQFCEKVLGVPVTLEDLRRWHSLEMMTTIMPHLELTDDQAGNPRLILAPIGGLGDEADMLSGLVDDAIAKKQEGGFLNRLRKRKGKHETGDDGILEADFDEVDAPDGPGGPDNTDNPEDEGKRAEDGGESDDGPEDEEPVQRRGCPFHDRENGLCQIYHALPTSCQAYPLGYNGSKYFIVDRECQGLGQGQMTVGSLTAIRDAARADFEARTETGQLLTTLHTLFMGRMAAHSARMMSGMDPEKLKQLGELLGHQPPGGSNGP